jgi:hypothetical protein
MEREELLSDLHSLIKHADEIIAKAIIHNNNQREIVIACLLAKLISHAKAFDLLVENHRGIEAEIIVRTAIETLFYMGACRNDDDALKDYLGKYTIDRLTAINIVKSDPEFDNEELRLQAKELLDQEPAIREEISQFGYRKHSVEKWAQKACLHWFYKAYRLHSPGVHSNIKHLLDSYTNNDGEVVTQININAPGEDQDLALVTMNTVMVLACRIYRGFFNPLRDHTIEKIESKYSIHEKRD